MSHQSKPVRTRRRTLTAQEIELWTEVTKLIKPMARPAAAPPTVDVKPGPDAPVRTEPLFSAPPAGSAMKLEVKVPRPLQVCEAPLVQLERRVRQRLARGVTSVDSALDLHGLRQDEAQAALRQFLFRAHASGARLVLVVTGKGQAPASDIMHERGVLRRNVPHWLRSSDLRSIVLGFEEASHRHGGAGALYVRLRAVRA